MFVFSDIKQYQLDLAAGNTTCTAVVQFYLKQINAHKKPECIY